MAMRWEDPRELLESRADNQVQVEMSWRFMIGIIVIILKAINLRVCWRISRRVLLGFYCIIYGKTNWKLSDGWRRSTRFANCEYQKHSVSIV